MADIFESARSLRPAFEAVDWAATALGRPETWSPTLRALTDLTLNTDFGVTLLWGPDFSMVYNEAYAPMIGDKHPAALGAPAREVFPEIWDEIGPMMRGVAATGRPVSLTDTRLLLERRGFAEECFFTFCYSSVAGPDGTVEGVVDIAVETTDRTIAARRLDLLTRLGRSLAVELHEPSEVLAVALPVLRSATLDLPAVDIRLPGGVATADPRLAGRPPIWTDDNVVIDQTDDGHLAWVRLATAATASEPLVLVALLSANLAFDDGYLDYLQLIADALATALDRIAVRAAETRSVAAERGLSEALQRSLLTAPVQPTGVDIAVRYVPASETARIGGDWYDAFEQSDGSTTVVVGDVSGHDRRAAAAMAQVRNMLRGVTFTSGPSPAAAVVGLDRAMQGLTAGTFATAVLGRIAPDGSSGQTRFAWSNAGHPPPVLVTATGETVALEGDVDVMLGVTPHAARRDHSVLLEPGSTVVLYTDGLVERRTEDLETSIGGLVDLLRDAHGRTAEQVCDDLLERYGPSADDDIALLVLRVHGTARR